MTLSNVALMWMWVAVSVHLWASIVLTSWLGFIYSWTQKSLTFSFSPLFALIMSTTYVQSLNHSWSVRLTKWWGAWITISTSKSWRPSNIMNICISAQSYQPKPRKWSKPQFCFFFLHKYADYAEHDWWHHQIHETIWDYLHMQHQVDRMNSTRENGQTRRINYAEYA